MFLLSSTLRESSIHSLRLISKTFLQKARARSRANHRVDASSVTTDGREKSTIFRASKAAQQTGPWSRLLARTSDAAATPINQSAIFLHAAHSAQSWPCIRRKACPDFRLAKTSIPSTCAYIIIDPELFCYIYVPVSTDDSVAVFGRLCG